MTYRLAEHTDVRLYFDWANDPQVRMNAHNTDPIHWEGHVKWFSRMIESKALMLVFFEGLDPVGQLRVDEDGAIDLSVDRNHRKRGVATEMLNVLILLKKKIGIPLTAEVKQTNIASNRAFEKAGFILNGFVNVNGVACNKFIYPVP